MLLFLQLLRESLRFAYSSVIVNKVRTLLTLSGITIGIFSIISVLTIFNSMEKNVRNSISEIGDDIIYIQKFPWEVDFNAPWWEYMKRPDPKVSEYRELNRRSQLADKVCFTGFAQRTVKQGNNVAENTNLTIVSYEYYDLKPFDFEQGRYFTLLESENGRNSCILGSDIASKLFNNLNPIGKNIDLMGYKLAVVGVVKKMGTEASGGTSLDELVILPLNFARRIFDIVKINPSISVKAKPNVTLADLRDELTMLMRSIRRLKPMVKDNFALNQSSMLTKLTESIFGKINMVGWIIGGFSMLVGGFGIANIMFVSVKERTHIIGIQKACGAKNYVILVEFLYESVILSIAGGILGLLFVFLGTVLCNWLTDFTISLTIGNILLGLIVSGSIGIISGFAPAWSAARLNPVDAINSHF